MAEVASHANTDMLNELLIAKLLEDDMLALENTRAAEELQFHEALSSSALASGGFPDKAEASAIGAVGKTDNDLVLDVLGAEINASKDALMAQALQHAEDSNMAASRQQAEQGLHLASNAGVRITEIQEGARQVVGAVSQFARRLS